MLLTIYKAIMRASTPLLEAYLKKRQVRGKEDPVRFPERRGRAARARGDSPLVWFHAASVGESLSLLSVISRLLQDYPALSIMVTTGTVTSAKLMAERLPKGAFHQYMPVDHPAWVARFLDHWRPDLVVWAESELWPNMLINIGQRRIPALLLNARMSETSFKRWKWAKGSISSLLSVFSLCLAQNAAEAQRLTELGAKDVRVSANLKYAAAPLPCEAAKLSELQKQTAGKKLLLWASTHPGEEEIALETHLSLKKDFPDLSTIIVPRHPQRGTEVQKLAQSKNCPVALRSKAENFQEIYIADTLGELGLFFRLCKTVIMGGSFADIGGHNPIEPAQLGCSIFFGPQMYNFVTITEDFLSINAAIQVKDAADLQQRLHLVLAAPENLVPMAQAAQKMTEEKSHIVDDLAKILHPYVASVMQERKAAS